jgi:hypothetical protein
MLGRSLSSCVRTTAQDRPTVVKRDDVVQYLAGTGVERDLDHTIRAWSRSAG